MSQAASPGPSPVFPAEPKGRGPQGSGVEVESTCLDANPGSICGVPGK